MIAVRGFSRLVYCYDVKPSSTVETNVRGRSRKSCASSNKYKR